MSEIVQVWSYMFTVASRFWSYMATNTLFAFIITLLVIPLLVKFYNKLKTVLK